MLQRAAHLVQVFAQDRALFLHGPGQTIQCIIRAEDGGQSLISWSSMFTSMRIMTILYYRDFPLTAARAREDRRRALFSARGRCYLGASPRGNGQRIFCSLRPRCRLLRHPVEAGHAIMAAQLFLLPFVWCCASLTLPAKQRSASCWVLLWAWHRCCTRQTGWSTSVCNMQAVRWC